VAATAIVEAFALHQRTASAQAERISLQQNLRAGLALLPAELRALNATDGDILKMSATSITIRALRKLAILCQVPALSGGGPSVTLTVRQTPFYGARFDNTRDGIYVFYDGDESLRGDDAWVLGRITSAPVNTAKCSDGKPAYSFTTNLALGALPAVTGRILNGAPVWGYRQTTYGMFQHTDGRWYVGVKDSSAAMTPVVGPLVGGNGLTFTYYDSNGLVTTDSSRVARIGIAILSQTATPVRQAGVSAATYQVDSLSTYTTLRNNPRW
jgi:hypothetical protein